MAQEPFGGAHTVKKLDNLEKYLKAFLMVFQNKDWAHTIYFDGFAGTGEVPTSNRDAELPLGDDDQAFIVGSAQRALRLEQKFHEYVFVEKSRGKARELETRLKASHPDRNDVINVINADANVALRRLCTSRDWRKCRAVVFLDPFGSQVDWSTIELVAKTKAIDFWYLFPAGLSVNRQIGKSGVVHETHEEPLDRLFGVTVWREAFVSEEEIAPDLFGAMEVRRVKTATPESVTKFMIERLSTVFEGGVLDEYQVLGRGKAHWYSLLFACANPSTTASALALKLAKAVLRSKQGGRKK